MGRHALTEDERTRRFWVLVRKERRGSNCWRWTGYRDPDGYGRRNWSCRTRQELAHRIAWYLASGSWPDDAVCHTCDQPDCVRNDTPGEYVVDGVSYPRWGHLFLATQSVNDRDRHQKGRSSGPHCPLKGTMNPAAKLSDDVVRTIYAQYWAGGLTQRALADEYGVSQRAIWQVVHRLKWQHVHSPSA